MSNQSNLYKRRRIGFRPERTILIVCEGEKTEPNYFKAFEIDKDLIDVKVDGVGRVNLSLVEYVVKLKNDAISIEKPYLSVWCVFDRDPHPENTNDKNNFMQAISLAGKNQINVAYSIEAFEIWYILHFDYYQTGSNRNEYKKILTKKLGAEYQKNDTKMYEKLKGDKQLDAIRNAKKLIADCSKYNNPSTTVYRLVEFLNKYLEE